MAPGQQYRLARRSGMTESPERARGRTYRRPSPIVHLAFGILVLLAACSTQPASNLTQPSGDALAGSGNAGTPNPPKTLVIGVPTDLSGLATQFNLTGQTTLTSYMLHQFVDTTLTVRDQNANPTPLLAAQLPSL